MWWSERGSIGWANSGGFPAAMTLSGIVGVRPGSRHQDGS